MSPARSGREQNCRRSGTSHIRDLKDAYREQVRGLIDGGSDLLIVETCQDLLQTKAALAAIFELFEKQKVRIPVIAQVTIEVFGTMLNGTEIGAALTALEPFPIDVIGMNCGTGPKHMTDSFRYLCENSPLPVSVLPNAGLARGQGRASSITTKRRKALPRRSSILQRISGRTSSAAAAARRRNI